MLPKSSVMIIPLLTLILPSKVQAANNFFDPLQGGYYILLLVILLTVILISLSLYLFNIKLKEGIRKRTEELNLANIHLSKEIEERKASEHRETQSRDRYKITFDKAAEAIVIMNANGSFLDFNAKAHESLGYTRAEFAKLTIYDIEAGRSRFEIKQAMSNALKEGGSEFVTRHKTRDGKLRDTLVKSSIIRLGGETCFQSHWNDITEQKQYEKELLNREQQLRKMVAKAPYPLCILDDNQEILFINDKFTETFGYTIEDVSSVEEWWQKAYPFEDYRSKVRSAWTRAINKAQKTNTEITPQEWMLCCKNGEYRSVEIRMVPLGDKSLIAMQDLTTTKEIEENLRIAKDKAEEANLAKTEFLANMSHEIRTPLNGVMGMLQLAQMTELDEEQRNYIDTGIASAKSLLRILADILDLSKIESGKLDIEQNVFCIRAEMKPVIDSFSQEVVRKKLDFSYEIWPEVPESLIGDQVRIRQILYNLVGNAIKFTEEGSVRLEVYPLIPDRSKEDIYIHFAVKDTGIGIKDWEMEYIFDSFTQADSSHTRRFGGTGLGLSMVKRLVNLMGGSVDVSSEFGVGTDVHVTLKLAMAESPAAPLEKMLPDFRNQTADKIRSILLVEDERINQIAISKLLEKHGYTVTCADNGKKALETLCRDSYDCILMDIQMPVLNGMAATKMIRSSPEFKMVSQIPIIALTAHAMTGDREKFIESGMNDYLPKPVDADLLLEMLENFQASK